MSSQQATQAAPVTPVPTAAFVASNLLVCSMLWGSSLLLIKLSGKVEAFYR